MKMFKFQKRIGAKIPSPFYGAHSAVVWRSILGEGPYRMRALINVANNPMLSAGHTEIVEKALKALDLLVVQDIYMTPTAELADYVTPAQAFEYGTQRFHLPLISEQTINGRSVSDIAIAPLSMGIRRLAVGAAGLFLLQGISRQGAVEHPSPEVRTVQGTRFRYALPEGGNLFHDSGRFRI